MCYGGNVIWSGGITEVRIEDEQGGKGGPAITTVSYSYYADFAIALHEEVRGDPADLRRRQADPGYHERRHYQGLLDIP